MDITKITIVSTNKTPLRYTKLHVNPKANRINRFSRTYRVLCRYFFLVKNVEVQFHSLNETKCSVTIQDRN